MYVCCPCEQTSQVLLAQSRLLAGRDLITDQARDMSARYSVGLDGARYICVIPGRVASDKERTGIVGDVETITSRRRRRRHVNPLRGSVRDVQDRNGNAVGS